jgi:hypothetical protein
LLSALLWLTFDAGFASGDDRRARVGFVLITIAAAWTQYYLAFVSIALVAGLVRSDAKRLRAACIALAVAGLGVLPLLSIARTQVAAHNAQLWPLTDLKTALDPMFDFVLPHGFVGHGVLAELAYGLVVLAVIILVFLGKPAWTPRVRTGAISLAVLLALYFLLMLIVRIDFIVPRHAAGLLPLAFACVCALSASLRSRRRGTIRVLLAALFTACSLATLFTTYHTGAKLGDWRRVGNYLDARVRPGDIVAVFDPESELPLHRYLHAPVPLEPLPQPLGYAPWSVSRYALHSASQAQHWFSSHTSNRAHVWLVVDETCSTDPVRYGCSYLEDAVRANFLTLSTATFFGSSVRELATRGVTPVRVASLRRNWRQVRHRKE